MAAIAVSGSQGPSNSPTTYIDVNFVQYSLWKITGNFPYDFRKESLEQTRVFSAYIQTLVRENLCEGFCCIEDLQLALQHFEKAFNSPFFNQFDKTTIDDARSKLKEACNQCKIEPPLYLYRFSFDTWFKTGEFPFDQSLSIERQREIFVTYIDQLFTAERSINKKRGCYNYKRENVELAIAHFEKASQSNCFKLFNGEIMDRLKAQLQYAALQVRIPLPLSLHEITSACPIR
jgi:hypothetical protein